MPKIERIPPYSGPGCYYQFWCPGCQESHRFSVGTSSGPQWTFDGNMEQPTFAPSLRYPSKPRRCHLFVKGGKIEFLSDCDHPLAGKTVDLPLIPADQLWNRPTERNDMPPSKQTVAKDDPPTPANPDPTAVKAAVDKLVTAAQRYVTDSQTAANDAQIAADAAAKKAADAAAVAADLSALNAARQELDALLNPQPPSPPVVPPPPANP